MGLKEDVAEYTQPDGLISPDKNPTPDSTGNGLLYLSIYHILMVKLGLAREEDLASFENTVESCYVSSRFLGMEYVYDGLLQRSPTKKSELESMDDYIGVACAGYILRSTIPQDIFKQGMGSHWFLFRWFYNNLSPGRYTMRTWFGRQPQVIAHLEWCAGQTPPLLRRMYWALSVCRAAIFDAAEPQSVIMHRLMCMAKRGSFMCSLASAFWSWRVQSVWKTDALPDGLEKAMQRALYLHLGMYHPLGRYWR